jgi:hypothetical protein
VPSEKTLSDYFDTTGREDILTGGIKMIPIQTPYSEFKVWTKRIGNNPTIKVLLLHGGPAVKRESNTIITTSQDPIIVTNQKNLVYGSYPDLLRK